MCLPAFYMAHPALSNWRRPSFTPLYCVISPHIATPRTNMGCIDRHQAMLPRGSLATSQGLPKNIEMTPKRAHGCSFGAALSFSSGISCKYRYLAGTRKAPQRCISDPNPCPCYLPTPLLSTPQPRNDSHFIHAFSLCSSTKSRLEKTESFTQQRTRHVALNLNSVRESGTRSTFPSAN